MNSLSVAAQVSLVLLGILAVLGMGVLTMLFVQIRRIGRELNRQAGPLLERSRTLAANLEYISAQVRTDVESLNGAVRALSDRLHQASDHMEARIDEFNALMEVVQGEAEGMFLDTAATMRGIRAGAQRLTDPEEGAPASDPATDPEVSPRERSA